MRSNIQRIIKEYISITQESKLVEGSKRTELHPRTMWDLNHITDVVWSASKKKNDDPPLKGTIYVEDPTGAGTDIPVYYLSDFENQGAVFEIDPSKPRNLYNLFVVLNPGESAVESKKSVYNTLYHEIQHLMDLHTTHYLTDKEKTKYDSDVDEKYYGHDFEFRAYTNEFLQGLENEYMELVGKHEKEELFKKSIILPVSAPFHCKLMKPAAEQMKNLILNSDFQEPEIPIISNVTAKEETDRENIKNLLIEQIYSKVRWREIVEFMIKNKVSEVYELGPGKSLSAMIKRFNTDIVLQNYNSMEEVNKLSKLL